MKTPSDLEHLSDDELLQWCRRSRTELVDAPPAVVAAARALWRDPQPSLLRRIAAALRFDSWAGEPALALRTVAHDTRHLLFSAEGRDVDLRIAPGDGAQWRLAGQVLGPGEGGEVRLEAAEGGSTPRTAALDDLGAFEVDGLAPGRWHLQLRFDGELIELPPLQVGPAG